MQRLSMLAALTIMGALMFASAALAQDPCPDPNFPRETPDGCQASNLPDVSFGPDASASSSTSVSSSASASASASDSSSASARASAKSSASTSVTVMALPETGGVSAAGAMLPLALLIGGGLLALRAVRRS